MSITLTHSGLPDGCSRFELLSAFEAVAKIHYRLSRTAIALVRHYVLKTSDEDYLRGRICAVWGQVCRTARALSLSPRSINSAGSVAKIVKLEHAWRRLDGRNDDGFQVAPFPG